MATPRKAGLGFIFIVLLLDTLGIGVIIPVLPKLIESFTHETKATANYYGAFVAVYAGMQFVFAPIIGALSDRFGRRTVILTSLAGAAADYVLLAYAPSLGWLFVGRVISGITGASFAAASAYIADVTPPEKRAQSFGLIGAAFGIGFVLGPAMGGLLGDHYLRAPFLVSAALNFLNFGYGLFVLPESLTAEHRRPFSLARANPFSALRNIGAHPITRGLAGTLVCAYLAQAILQSAWALYGQARFGWRPFDVGISLAIVGLASGAVQGGLVRVVVPKLGERKAVMVGLLFNITGFLGFGLATRGWLMYLLILPFALGGIAGPAIQALLSREVGPKAQGQLQGSLTSLQSITAVLGPIVGTLLFARFGPEEARPRVPGAPYFAAALFNTVGLLLAVRLFRRLPATAPAAAQEAETRETD